MAIKHRFTEDSYRKEPWFRALVQAFLTCKTEEEMGDLLRDIGTLGELQDWCERLDVARLLVTGKSYRQVASEIGVSTTTVTRVARAIENGTGGYRKLLHAHRHHRMMHAAKTSSAPSPNETPARKQASEPSAEAPKPVSVLQKYLGRK